MAFVYGLITLAALLFLARAFTRANPQKMARMVRIAGGLAAVIFGTLLIFRGAAVVGGPLAAFGAMLLGFGNLSGFPHSAGQTSPSSQGQSEVKTTHLEMRLDHASGHMDGLVLRGRHQTALLSELPIESLLDLLRSYHSIDPQSAQLLASYLDWREPDWRRSAGPEGGEEGNQPSPGDGELSRDAALSILGLQEGASEEEIRKAHRRLMKLLHPDHGGTSYLAAQINAAKEKLLGGNN